ncbi:MAG: acyl--CoA ligase [Planctomycetes bacterium]|nr:acyl--CoA ligase [Planctomycetota bacterium]
MALQLIERLYEHAAARPDAVALREVSAANCAGRVMSYRILLSAVERLATVLHRDLPERAVVIVALPNELEYFVAFYAVLLAGRTVFPVHPLLAKTELQTAAKRSQAVAFVAAERSRGAFEKIGLRNIDVVLQDNEPQREHTLERHASDSACLLLQSSGTTGRPKIVQRSGRSLDAVAGNVATSVALVPDDRVLGLVPACHSYGVENVALGPLWAGCEVHLCHNLDTTVVLRRLTHAGVTVFPGVPAMFDLLAQLGHAGERLTTLRSAYSAGAMLPAAVLEAFERVFGVRIGQLFGMTEIGSVTFNDPGDESHDPSSVGLPMTGVRVRIVDPDTRNLSEPLVPNREGEVAVSAPSMLTGYLDDDGVCQAPSEMCDGFFLTGDLGRLDDRGRLTITGRLKLVIDVGGHKVNLLEVESVLQAHPAVAACVVVPVPVSKTVSRLKAVVELESGGPAPTSDELRSAIRAKLSAHKVPRMIEFRDKLPRSPTGKILRRIN